MSLLLVVDDDAHLLRALRITLRASGHEVVTVGWEALEVSSAAGQVIVTYHAEVGSRAERLLADLVR